MDVDALRAVTPGCKERIHLNNAGAGLLSQPTIDAMVDYLHLEATIGGYEAAEVANEVIDDCSRELARLLGGRHEEVVLFDNATRAWHAAFYSVPLRPGDRIVTGRAEYGSNVLAYLQVAERTGATVVVVPDDRHGQLDVDALAAVVDERTRLVGFGHIPTSGGLVNPAPEIARVAHDAGALVLVDATQSVGQLPLDVEAMGCDLLSGAGRKFLRGPRGTGFLWVRDSIVHRLAPHVAELGSASWDGGRSFEWASGARRFDSWERSYVNVVGLGAALRQANELDMHEVAARATALGTTLRGRLDDVPGVTTRDLGLVQCAIVTATVDGVAAQMVKERLRLADINVTTTAATHSPFDAEVRDVHPLVRFSPHYYNTEEEIDRAVEVVGDIAGASSAN